MKSLVDIGKNGNITLPIWLDEYIFSHFEASFRKQNTNMLVLNWNANEMLEYLGTYFPRSFAESYSIFRRFIRSNPKFLDLSNISIFDFGCGCGGELVGMILAMKEFYPNIHQINIKALDGNIHALRLLEAIVDKLSSEVGIDINLNPIPIVIDDFYDLSVVNSVLSDTFDCIITFKAICEFVTKQQFEEKNPYGYIADALTSKLNKKGVLCIADITSFSDVSKEWLCSMMDNGLAQSKLSVIASNIGYNEKFMVSHSHKQEDYSKLAWRILSPRRII